MSSSSSPRRSPEPEERPKPHKIFVTGLNVDVPPARMEEQLEELFARYGKLDSVVVKKSFNNEYSFAFIEYKEGEDASEAVHELNNVAVEGKKMKVELQDNSRRRKGGLHKQTPKNQTCFRCGKPGHFARNCNQARQREESRSESESRHRHKKHKKKHHRRSYSSDSDSRRHKRKSEKKKKSKKVKKHSKSKKSHKYSDSESSP